MERQETVLDFTVVFEKLEGHLAESSEGYIQSTDRLELEQIRILRELVAETVEPQQAYFTRT